MYTGDISSDATQKSINDATSSDGVKDKADVSLPGNVHPVGAATKHSFTQLPAGKYYLYAQIDDQRVAGYTFESLWSEASADVPPYSLLQFSTNTLKFDSPIPGKFNKKQNLDNYTMRNAGNIPIDVSLKSITRNPESSPKISLVDKFNTKNQELILSLIAEKTDSGDRVVFGPLVEKDPLNPKTIQLNPFWDTDSKAKIYLASDYSGPMIGP